MRPIFGTVTASKKADTEKRDRDMKISEGGTLALLPPAAAIQTSPGRADKGSPLTQQPGEPNGNSPPPGLADKGSPLAQQSGEPNGNSLLFSHALRTPPPTPSLPPGTEDHTIRHRISGTVTASKEGTKKS